jgi:hypothetical protein
MSQADIDAFVDCAGYGTLTPEGVTTAVVTKSIPVNERHSSNGFTALHWAVVFRRRELVIALLVVGADANVKHTSGATSVAWSVACSTTDILQLLIYGGGSVNESDNGSWTSLIAIPKYGDAAAKLEVLLACPELELDAELNNGTAEEWAVLRQRHHEFVATIAQERARRKRWSLLRSLWIVATISLSAP